MVCSPLSYINVRMLRLTAPNTIHFRKAGRPVSNDQAHSPLPASSTQTSQLLCNRSGVKPKQEM